MTIATFLRAAMAEVNIIQAGDTPSGEDEDLALLVLNELLDAWNSDERALYAEGYADYTLTPALLKHTIGPAGTFNVTVRPARILAAAVAIGGSPTVYQSLTLFTTPRYETEPVPAQSSSPPQGVFYEPDFPLGSLYFWPVPSAALGVRLWTSTLLSQVTLVTVFALPPGYQQALRKTLAELLVNAFAVQMPPLLPSQALEARARVFSVNDEIPRLVTASSGLCGGGGQNDWDYRSGRVI